MDTRIENRVGVRASAERIWDILADFSRWDRWNPYETGLKGALGFGAPLELTEVLPDMGERQVQAHIREWQPNTQLIWSEKRGWLFNAVRYYEIEELAPGSCIVANGVIFTGLRGELFHDKHRPAIRAAYEAIGESLRQAAQA